MFSLLLLRVELAATFARPPQIYMIERKLLSERSFLIAAPRLHVSQLLLTHKNLLFYRQVERLLLALRPSFYLNLINRKAACTNRLKLLYLLDSAVELINWLQDHRPCFVFYL